MQLGKAIRTIRASCGLSQGELAGKANVASSYISLLESGHREPTMSVAKAIAKALDVPMYLLMLIASDDEDLRDVNAEQVKKFGADLLQLILKLGKKKSKRKSGKKKSKQRSVDSEK